MTTIGVSMLDSFSIVADRHNCLGLTEAGGFLGLAVSCAALLQSVAKFFDHGVRARQGARRFFGVRKRVIQAEFDGKREVSLLQLVTNVFWSAPGEIG